MRPDQFTKESSCFYIGYVFGTVQGLLDCTGLRNENGIVRPDLPCRATVETFNGFFLDPCYTLLPSFMKIDREVVGGFTYCIYFIEVGV